MLGDLEKTCSIATPTMIRKLASIQTLAAIEPIANADAIELVHIQGCQCVVK